MSCPTIVTIQPTECIGNSLNTINNNYQSLKTGLCDNYDQINSLRTLLYDLSASVTPLIALKPGIAKAWVNFDGTRNSAGNIDSTNTSRYIRSSYKISSVLRNEEGNYTINFATPFANNNYAAVATSIQVVATPSKYTPWCFPYSYEAGSFKVKHHVFSDDNNKAYADPTVVSIVVFAN